MSATDKILSERHKEIDRLRTENARLRQREAELVEALKDLKDHITKEQIGECDYNYLVNTIAKHGGE